jgi:hypothetical protein
VIHTTRIHSPLLLWDVVQSCFTEEDKRSGLRLIASPDGADGSVLVHQNAYLYVSAFFAHALPPLRRSDVLIDRFGLCGRLCVCVSRVVQIRFALGWFRSKARHALAGAQPPPLSARGQGPAHRLMAFALRRCT